MNTKNDYIRDFTGVTAWHKAGYTGKRVVIASAEDFVNAAGPYAHEALTYHVAREFAPDAQYVYVSITTAQMGDNLLATSAYTYWGSLSFPNSDGVDQYLAEAPDATVLFSAGNDGATDASGYIRSEHVYGVGAVALTWSSMTNGVPDPGAELLIIPAAYSSESEHVDFGAPTGVFVLDDWLFNGTSCAAPALAGMCAIVNDFFIKKTGRPLTREMMYQFMKDCSMDLEQTGHDDKTGWGIPILPAPENVNIGRYSPGRGTNLAKTNTGLVEYAKAQLGKPYWMGTFGQTATARLYAYNKSRLPEHYTANDFSSQYGERVHDCVGLIKGYLWSDGANTTPYYNGTQDYSADSMRSACKEKGSISTLPELPGTLVFYDGHVGVYIGAGEVVEARGHAYGVVKTKLSQRPWLYWGKCPLINYYEEDEEMTNERFAEHMATYLSSLNTNDCGNWSKAAREWAIATGLIEGNGTAPNGEPLYSWKGFTTREQFVTFLHRFAKTAGLV